MIKLLAIDMDGTCLNNRKKITEKTMTALKAAADKSILVIPATGRSLDSLPHQLKEETFYRYVITSNGARVTDVKENKTLFSALIPLQDAIKILSEGKQRKLGLTAHAENKNVVEGAPLALKGKLVYGKDTKDSKVTNDITLYLKEKKADVEEVQLFFFSERNRWWAKDIAAKNKGYTSAFGENYVEFCSSETSKGIALAYLAEQLGIEKEEIACIGDGENDLTMFENSGLKIAVGNADVALQAKADLVVATNKKDGVAEAIEKILSEN